MERATILPRKPPKSSDSENTGHAPIPTGYNKPQPSPIQPTIYNTKRNTSYRRSYHNYRKIAKRVIALIIAGLVITGIVYVFVVPSDGQGLFIHVDRSWMNSFINDVNGYRMREGAVNLTLDPQLDNFSQLRFTTMTTGSNYEISHYGFDSDAGSFFGSSYQYEMSLGEVVFYPQTTSYTDFIPSTQTYTPSGFVSYLQSNAPGHWQELLDMSLSHYGYYVGQGPTYQIDQGCANTEIPGPNINISQFFDQEGCSYSVGSGLWLVIDLSS
jgi:uncharacterized protein YkwD